MVNRQHDKLDNPVWHSLHEIHRPYMLDHGNTCFYRPEFCPFGSSNNGENSAQAIDSYARLTNEFYMVGEKPALSVDMKIQHELVCDQMIFLKDRLVEIAEEVVQLNDKFEEDLFHLVDLVQPGYFRKQTSRLGKYYGIFKNDMLVAVCGERMKMNEYTEVSAVVTHRDFVGKGFAKQLISYTVKNILKERKIPYLHVSQTNEHAIGIYEKLGFVFRRKISFWKLGRG